MSATSTRKTSVIGGRSETPFYRQLDLIEALILKHGGTVHDRRHIPGHKGQRGRIYVEFSVSFVPGANPATVRPETQYDVADGTNADHAASALMVLVKAIFVGIQYHVGLQTGFGAMVDPSTGVTLTEKALRGELYGMPAIEDRSR